MWLRVHQLWIGLLFCVQSRTLTSNKSQLLLFMLILQICSLIVLSFTMILLILWSGIYATCCHCAKCYWWLVSGWAYGAYRSVMNSLKMDSLRHGAYSCWSSSQYDIRNTFRLRDRSKWKWNTIKRRCGPKNGLLFIQSRQQEHTSCWH